MNFSDFLKKDASMNTLFCLTKLKDSETYHIYECKKTYNECNHTNDKKSKCGSVEFQYTREIEDIEKCKTETEMRTKIAELANQGTQICGRCVSHLYKND